LYTTKRRLLDEHAQVVHDVTAVKRHLDDITFTVETLLQGRPYWVLIEEQFTKFKADPEAKRHTLVFTLQLESCIRMYFVQKGMQVRTIHATKDSHSLAMGAGSRTLAGLGSSVSQTL
jgi:hypothetical protein